MTPLMTKTEIRESEKEDRALDKIAHQAQSMINKHQNITNSKLQAKGVATQNKKSLVPSMLVAKKKAGE